MLLCTVDALIGTTDTKTTTCHISLRTSTVGRRSLENLTDINIGHAAAEILGTLKTGIGTTNMEMTHDSFNIARASTGRNLVETLQSDRTTEVIDRSGNDRTACSGKAGSIHQICMILLDRELIVNGTRNTNTSRIAKTDVKIRSKDRRRSSSRTSTLILDHEFQRTVSLNRTTFADNRQLHIRATLWSGEGRSEVIFQPTAGKKITENRSFEIRIFPACKANTTIRSRINRQLVIDILVTIILVPNQTITTERKNGDRSSSRNTIRNTSFRDITTCIGLGRQAESGNETILGLVSPIALAIRLRASSKISTNKIRPLSIRRNMSILTRFTASNEIFPMIPNEAVRNKKVMNVHPKTAKGRRRKRHSTYQRISTNTEAITG